MPYSKARAMKAKRFSCSKEQNHPTSTREEGKTNRQIQEQKEEEEEEEDDDDENPNHKSPPS
jgi:hypothetical protein